jgi:Cys-rich protein (TIGR01571 family)
MSQATTVKQSHLSSDNIYATSYATEPDIEVPVVEGVSLDGREGIMKTAGAKPMDTTAASWVEVVAPTDMRGGYRFQVHDGTQNLWVEVPSEGVTAGQRFNARVVTSTAADPHNIPTGRWRDDLCDCLSLGCCHAHFCMGLWCRTCALGQVMTRMKLNAWARPLSAGHSPKRSACKIILFWSVLFSVLNFILQRVIVNNSNRYDGDDNIDNSNQDTETNDPGWVVFLSIMRSLTEVAFVLYVLILTIRTRQYIRQKYTIPETRCHGCEDCCCSFWCAPCVTCQLLRQSADYRLYPASCCSEDGLTSQAPEVV